MSTAAQQQTQREQRHQEQQAPSKPPSASAGYEVSRPHGKCLVTGVTIEPGTRFMAALRETPAGFERLDVSLDAWPTFDRKDVLAFWQTVMPSPQQTRKKLFVDDQVLCELFERLAQAVEPAKLNFRFVLGLILMRKRMIIYESSRVEDGREIWEVRFKGREQRLDLLNPQLDEQQVSEVSQQLGEILNEEI
jgi:hypothetical protein